MAETLQERKEIARQVYDALNDRDRDAFSEVLAADCVLHVGGEEFDGRNAIIEMQWGMFAAFSNNTFTVEDTIAEGDKVTSRVTISGTHDGELSLPGSPQPIPATGNEFEISGIHVARIEDGEVTEVWLHNDTFGLLQQLGVLDAPGT